MALRIRVSRYGRRHHPIYRLVVADAKAPRDGKVVDVIATYDPVNKRLIEVKEEKLKEWLQKGAEITERAKAILKNSKIL
ncbi:30S ribosomal protein S16 [Hydrogenobacter sp. T-2]|uniref:30S ribosomal protein S16 n=1 Tax=Pampinifervens diazotrophicum TaxID=1632018 RepID=UPI002B259574|nr:30S ribosomal protein S16 [Hydrogenobacter sp. T-2]WPM31603.1 30S ribosomal protein S16 [Hydrogenobacter sp. T-2]